MLELCNICRQWKPEVNADGCCVDCCTITAATNKIQDLERKVKALRYATREVHDRMHYFFDPDDDWLDEDEIRECISDYISILNNALKETQENDNGRGNYSA